MTCNIAHARHIGKAVSGAAKQQRSQTPTPCGGNAAPQQVAAQPQLGAEPLKFPVAVAANWSSQLVQSVASSLQAVLPVDHAQLSSRLGPAQIPAGGQSA